MSIGYNVLNLPNSISKSSESISYVYSALGEKLAKRMKDNSYQYYAGNMVYKNDKSLNYLLFEEGLVNKVSGGYTYEYHLKDHLGNTRVTFQPNAGGTTTTQVAEYYPFGSSYSPISPAGTNKYLYNGKEKQDDVLGSMALDEYDYVHRFYDPQIALFTSIDIDAEKNRRWSPYAYAVDNPIRYEDYDGDGPKDRVKAARLLIAYGATYARVNGDRYRTGYSKEAMSQMDCAEFVCRVMAADGITPTVQNRDRGTLMSLVNDKSRFESSKFFAQKGDIAVWYGEDKDGMLQFHTGIVTDVDKNGNFKLAHAAGSKSKPNILENPNFTTTAKYDPGIEFQGFYRPVPEQETKDDKNISITSDTKTSENKNNSAINSTESQKEKSKSEEVYDEMNQRLKKIGNKEE